MLYQRRVAETLSRREHRLPTDRPPQCHSERSEESHCVIAPLRPCVRVDWIAVDLRALAGSFAFLLPNWYTTHMGSKNERGIARAGLTDAAHAEADVVGTTLVNLATLDADLQQAMNEDEGQP